MADRDTTVERERPPSRDDVDVPVDAVGQERTATASGGGLRSRVRARAGSLFSVRAFLLSTVATVVGFVLVGGALPLGSVAGLLGIAVGSFLAGVTASERRYLEAAVAGGAVAGSAAFLDHLPLTVVGLGLPLVAVGAVGGALAGLVGHYFGRDLRDGLTREL